MSLDLGVPAISGPEKGLQRYEAVCRALAAAHRLDEVKEIRDRAEALRAYGQQARDNDLVSMAAEIKLRAERRAGDLIREMRAGGRLRKRGESGQQTQNTLRISLIELGITRLQAHKWEIEATVPEEEFENWLNQHQPKRVATTFGLMKLAHILGTKRSRDVGTRLEKARLSVSERQFRELQDAWFRAWPTVQERFAHWLEDQLSQRPGARS